MCLCGILLLSHLRDLLQEAIKGMDVAKGTSQGCSSPVSTILVQPLEVENPKKISKPPPFYLSLIIGDKLVHIFMIDSGPSSLVMPKGIADFLGIKYEPITRGVVQLDGT